jgi:predicted nucleotidyltransferase
MHDMTNFDAAEHEVLTTLIQNNVRFLIIGGCAVTVHGYERGVGDLDLLVEPSVENAIYLLAALKELGLSGVALKRLAQAGKRLPLPRYGVEIFTSLEGITFDEALARKATVKCGDFDVPVLSLEDVVRSKSGTGRVKDRRDIRRLLRR